MIEFPKRNTRKYSDSTRLTSSYDTSLDLINPHLDKVVLSRKRGQVIKISPPLVQDQRSTTPRTQTRKMEQKKRKELYKKGKKLWQGWIISTVLVYIRGTMVTPLRIFLRCSNTSSSVNSSADTIRDRSSAPEYSKPQFSLALRG
jgi:hypothetical protein